MSIIEQAAKRLQQLERAGIAVPWTAAGVDVASELARSATTVAEDRPAESVAPDTRAVTEARAGAAQERIVRSRSEPHAEVALDLEMLREAGYLVPDQVRSEMAEQFRHLKRPLLKNARAKADSPDNRGSLIMVTSAVPGEGKTFCSINLAMSMAMEVDTGVILIDADVVRPSVFSRFGIKANPPGLLDLLTRSDLELHDALVSTNVPKLSVMASGGPSERSTELLSSAAMDRLLARLAVEYADHVVIFDAPPLLLTTESSVLASKVGQVVVVVEAARTQCESVKQAFSALQNCPVVLSVLNKCDEPGDRRRYSYY